MRRKRTEEEKPTVARYLNKYFNLFPTSAHGFSEACYRIGLQVSEQTISKVRSGSIPPTHELILALKFFTPWSIDKILEEELKNRGVLKGK